MPRISITGRKNIFWTDEDKAAVVNEAKRAIGVCGYEHVSSLTTIIKTAQLVLPKEKHRNINSVNAPQFKWFRDAMQKRVATDPVIVSAPVPETVSMRVPARASSASADQIKGHAATKEYEASTGEIMGGVDSALDMLRSALKAALMQHAPARSSDDNVSVLCASVLDLSKIVGQCQQDIKALTESTRTLIESSKLLCQSVASGFADFKREATAQKQVTDKMYSGVCNTLAAVNTFHRELSYASRNGAGEPSLPEAVAKLPDLPRVIILGIESGHSKGYIIREVESRCKALRFEIAEGTPKTYKDFDIVVITKKVPLYWVADVKKSKIIEPERLFVVEGAAEAVAIKVRQIAEKWTEAHLQEYT